MTKRTTQIGIDALTAINNELQRASTIHGDIGLNSLHEGYAVLKEEVDELWTEIKSDEQLWRIRDEAIQVAAMAIRIINELIPINNG